VEIIGIEVEIIGIEVEIIGIEVEIIGIEVEIIGIEVEIIGIEVEIIGTEVEIIVIEVEIIGIEMKTENERERVECVNKNQKLHEKRTGNSTRRKITTPGKNQMMKRRTKKQINMYKVNRILNETDNNLMFF